jgi:hypothetical protein
MKNERIMPGIILVAIGAIFLLDNYNVIDFHWSNIWHLWPVFLIMGGVNLLLANNKAPWATGVRVLVVVGGFCVLIFAHTNDHWFFPKHYNFHYKDDDDDDDDDDSDTTRNGIVKVEGSSTYSEPFSATVPYAKVDISGGGTVYKLSDTTANMFEANTKEYYNRYIYNKNMEGDVPVFSLHMKNNKGHFDWDSDKGNQANIKLNTRPEWDINVNAGATELDFDLTPYKIRNVTINGGAASFHIKMGQPLASTNVEVKTGVSEVEIKVPSNAACRITSDSGLSSSNFDGFNKVNDGWETAGYNSAPKKINIHMKGGLSDFKVIKY